MVLEFPPRAFFSNLVSTESRYGTTTFFFPSESSANALITLPRVDNDLLMAEPSCNLAPVAPVASARSLY